jgi:hypothetical protein
MEKYSAYKKHTVDTYSKLLVSALKSAGIYDSQKHDAVIGGVLAPLFQRLEEARNSIAQYGMLITEMTREDHEVLKRNPACDLELAIVDRIRKMLKEINLFDAKKDDEDTTEEKEDENDSLTKISGILGGITYQRYKKPNA